MNTQTPPTRIETWLNGLPDTTLAVVIISTFVVICLACMVPSIIVRLGKAEAPARTMPTTSDRKSGRVRRG